MEAKKLNRRQARWSLYLSRFDFMIVYKARTSMGKANALSRRADHKEGVEHDNENVVLLKPEMLKIRALRQGHLLIEGEENTLLSKVRKAKEFDEDVIKAVEELKKTGTKTLRSDEWSLEQDLVLFRGKVYVPKDSKLRTEIIKLHHDTPTAGHPGQWKTLELVSRNYWWPNITGEWAAAEHGNIRVLVLFCSECRTQAGPSM